MNDASTTRAGGSGLPNLIVIGAQKCGTSTLHYYLSFHPDVSASDPKELNFFIEERNWKFGLDWYRSHFDSSKPVRLESSPNYTSWPHHDGVPERMLATCPDAKLIFLVRDPIQRIEAHWVHNYAKRRERGSMLETLLHPSTTYIERSMYAMQLERFIEVFGREPILVLEQEDLRADRVATLQKVFAFAGIDSDFFHPSFETVRHRTSKKRRQSSLGARVQEFSKTPRGQRIPKMIYNYAEAGLRLSRPIERPDLSGQLPDEVLAALRADASRLRELTGREFRRWSIWDHAGAPEPAAAKVPAAEQPT